MCGYIKQDTDGRMRPQFFREEIGGVPFLALRCGMPYNRWQRRRLRRALHKMTTQGVRQAVVPPDLIPYCQQAGIQPIEEAPLRVALMEQIIDRYCEQCGLDIHCSTVRLYGQGINHTVRQAAVLLVKKARYVELQLDKGQRELSEWLRWEYGLCAGNGGRGAILQICCHDDCESIIPTIWLGRNCEKRQRITYRLDRPWSEQIEAEPQLLSVLFAEGKLPTEVIHIKSVETYA